MITIQNEAFLTAILLDSSCYKVVLTDARQQIAKTYINQAECILKKARIQEKCLHNQNFVYLQMTKLKSY